VQRTGDFAHWGVPAVTSAAVLASLLLSDPSDDDTPIMEQCRERYAAMIARYFRP
jgi:hypothetical protein